MDKFHSAEVTVRPHFIMSSSEADSEMSYNDYHLETNFTSEYEIEAEHDIAHCSTDVNKTKEVRKIAKSTASNLDVTLENVQKLVDSIQDQFDSSSKVMSTLQGITNKHVEK